jgi:hypothetical protein
MDNRHKKRRVVLLLVLAVAVWCGTTAQADPPLPVIPATSFNITSFGALASATNNATAIQNTINAAGAAGGGTVEIPAGTYLSGPVILTNSINLQIDSGATLKMLSFGTYPTSGTIPDFISATSLHDVEISGTGTIDGSAANGSPGWWDGRATSERPLMIKIDTCQNVLIQDVHLKNPPKMHIGFKGTGGNITIQNITINTPVSPNTDGIDLAGTNCLVRNCTISDGDDNIAFSPTVGTFDSDILISNCTFGIGHGVSMGSNTAGGLSNLTVTSCTFTGTDYGIRMKSDNNTNTGGTVNGRGGVVQDLTYSNIQMGNIAKGAIVIYSYYNEYGTPTGITPFDASTQAVGSVPLPVWRNIMISNVTATVASGGVPGILWGRMEMVVSNVTLSQVTITAAIPFEVYNARAIQFIDSQFITGSTNALSLFNAEITVTNSAPSANVVTLGGLAKPGTNNPMAFFNAQVAVTDANLLGAGPITLGGSSLTFAQDSVNVSNSFSIISASTLAITSGSNTFSGALGGSGSLTLNLPASSVLSLRGNSGGFSGSLIVSNSGTLLVNNAAGSGTGVGQVTVLSGATLGGSGVIGGLVTVNGTLAPGNSPGTLTISNNLVLNSGAVLQYQLGAVSDRTVVSSNLTLGGTLNVTDAGGFTNGTYTLLTYGGTLATNGTPTILTIGSTPDATKTYTIDIATVHQVNLVVSGAGPPPVDPFVAWQLRYFGCTNLAICPQAAGDADPDGDGISNTNEFLAGTDPTNNASAFRITSVVRTNNDLFISWMTGVGRTNALQAAVGDANGNYQTNTFADLFTVTNTTGGVTNYTDLGAATNTLYRYYRIRLVP